MPARWLALVFVLALLPTVELVEQGVHVVEHALIGEPADHDAHHEEHDPGDEHGCTELVHVCGSHHGVGLGVAQVAPSATLRLMLTAAAARAPAALDDLATRTPPYRPPIA